MVTSTTRSLLMACSAAVDLSERDATHTLAKDLVVHLLRLHDEKRLTHSTLHLLLESVSGREEIRQLLDAAGKQSDIKDCNIHDDSPYT